MLTRNVAWAGLALLAVEIGSGAMLLAADAPKQDELKQRAQASHTQLIGLPSGGTLRFVNARGTLTVEAWDRPEVEITTIKSTKGEFGASERDRAAKKLDAVTVTAEVRGNELVVTTSYPRRRLLPRPFSDASKRDFDLEYRIKAPAATRIVDERHDVGEVNIDGLTGDIDVSLLQGEIMLHLPENGRYDIDAKTQAGSVSSDFPGEEKRRRWFIGHRFAPGGSGAPHRLNLRVGFGDIVLLTIRVPKAPEPPIAASKPEGL